MAGGTIIMCIPHYAICYAKYVTLYTCLAQLLMIMLQYLIHVKVSIVKWKVQTQGRSASTSYETLQSLVLKRRTV